MGCDIVRRWCHAQAALLRTGLLCAVRAREVRGSSGGRRLRGRTFDLSDARLCTCGAEPSGLCEGRSWFAGLVGGVRGHYVEDYWL